MGHAVPVAAAQLHPDQHYQHLRWLQAECSAMQLVHAVDATRDRQLELLLPLRSSVMALAALQPTLMHLPTKVEAQKEKQHITDFNSLSARSYQHAMQRTNERKAALHTI